MRNIYALQIVLVVLGVYTLYLINGITSSFLSPNVTVITDNDTRKIISDSSESSTLFKVKEENVQKENQVLLDEEDKGEVVDFDSTLLNTSITLSELDPTENINKDDDSNDEDNKDEELVNVTISNDDQNSTTTAPPVQVFYNLFVKSEEDEERVRAIITEQVSFLDPELHKEKVQVTSIGHPLSNMPNTTTIREHQENGSEGLTLNAIWNYCKENPNHDKKAVYLHSKGSFHDKPENQKLRQFLTTGALSKECANLPDTCDVCSSRMSPLPHPHTPGNMWLARCDYIAKLVDPLMELEHNFRRNNWEKGWGRFFFEHWIHSHPSVRPCDLYKGAEYVWNYDNIPDTFVPNLKMAPRFADFMVYNLISTASKEQHVIDRLWQYDQLYHERPDEAWWGWDFFNATYEESQSIVFN